MRAGIGDHQRREIGGVLVRLGAQVGHIDVAVAVAADHDHLQAGHRGARRVGAVRAGGDQADVAVPLAARCVVGADRQQAGILALRAGVRLQRDRGKAGDRLKPVGQARDQLGVALGLVGRRERMDVGEAGQGDRDHLGRGVQLHRAGAERDHAAVQRDVLLLQALEVAQHLVLGVVLVEHSLFEERRVARQARRDGGPTVRGGRSDALARRLPQAGEVDQRCQSRQLVARHRLVQRDADARVADAPQVEALRQCCLHQRIGTRRLDRDRVEERVVHARDGRPAAPHRPASAPAD